MLEFLVKNLLGNMPLVLTNKLFKSPLGPFFECCGIARDVSVIIDKTVVHLDFHIYVILEFNLLIGQPCEKLFKEKSFHEGLDEKLRTTTSATPIPCLEILMAKHNPNHNPIEEPKFISPFVSPRLPSETEHPSSSSLKPKPCPSSQHDITLEKENFWAMDKLEAPTLELEMNESTNEHERSSFEFPRVSCSLLESPKFIVLSTAGSYEDHNHLVIVVHKLFKRMVVDAYVYHKYCRSHGCIMVLTLQLEHSCKMFGGKAGNYTTIDSCKMSSQG
jgi:hypothetical protein